MERVAITSYPNLILFQWIQQRLSFVTNHYSRHFHQYTKSTTSSKICCIPLSNNSSNHRLQHRHRQQLHRPQSQYHGYNYELRQLLWQQLLLCQPSPPKKLGSTPLLQSQSNRQCRYFSNSFQNDNNTSPVLGSSSSSSSLLLHGSTQLQFHNVLIVIKQTAYEEYSQLKLRGQAPKALRWKRLEQRYRAHKSCVTDLLALLRFHHVNFSCVNRVELDRQHLVNVDLVIAVGGDGTVLSAAHFLDHGTIPLLGINSDPNISNEDRIVKQKITDERRSHGALCFCTSQNMDQYLIDVLYGNGHIETRTRIRCKVKSTFSETRLVPALNDLLLANPSPAAVSRFRMGWLQPVLDEGSNHQSSTLEHHTTAVSSDTPYGTVTRFGGKTYDVRNSINVWSSGMWVSTATGSTAAMLAAGGKVMNTSSDEIQYLIREHMIENQAPKVLTSNNNNNNNNDNNNNDLNNNNNNNNNVSDTIDDTISTMNNRIVKSNEKLHVRWNSQRGRIFIDGSHLTHDLELGDEILIDNEAPTLKMFSILYDQQS